MFSRVLSPSMQTTYSSSFDQKPLNKVRAPNLSTSVTTGSVHYTSAQESIYQSDVSDEAKVHEYKRPGSFKMELVKLPPEYASTVKPKLDPSEPVSNYQHCFGQLGQQIAVKRGGPTTIRQLSKQTQADINGTPKISHFPPGYTGHIPRGWKGNRGKHDREDRNLVDFTWQYHTEKTGYGGYVPSVGMDSDMSNVKHTMTTYREQCKAVHFDE